MRFATFSDEFTTSRQLVYVGVSLVNLPPMDCSCGWRISSGRQRRSGAPRPPQGTPSLPHAAGGEDGRGRVLKTVSPVPPEWAVLSATNGLIFYD